MPGDWIKMRGALLEHPKVIALGRVLHDNKQFREWLTPGGSGSMNGQIVSNEALRCVTTALLLKVWSVARETGKFVGKDLVLEHSVLSDLDQIAGVEGFGDAMSAVGWARSKRGITLPNFTEFNATMDNAERQREYRERMKQKRYQQSVTRGEERRDIKPTRENALSKSKPVDNSGNGVDWTDPRSVDAYGKRIGNPCRPGESIARYAARLRIGHD